MIKDFREYIMYLQSDIIARISFLKKCLKIIIRSGNALFANHLCKDLR